MTSAGPEWPGNSHLCAWKWLNSGHFRPEALETGWQIARTTTGGGNEIAKGIYSVAIGVTKSQNGHSVDENSEIEPIYAGIKQLIYIASMMD